MALEKWDLGPESADLDLGLRSFASGRLRGGVEGSGERHTASQFTIPGGEGAAQILVEGVMEAAKGWLGGRQLGLDMVEYRRGGWGA